MTGNNKVLNGGNPRAPNRRKAESFSPIRGERQGRDYSRGDQVDLEKIIQKGMNHEPTGNKDGTYRGNGKGERGVTAKQDKFALLVAQGKSLSYAYREAYDTSNMLDSSVWDAASKLADVPWVAQRVRDHVERIEREKPHDDAATRRMVRDYLVSVVQNPEAKTADRTKAAELLGKVAGVALFSQREKEAVTKPASHAEFEALFNRLSELVQSEAVETTEVSSFGERTETEPTVIADTPHEAPTPPGTPLCADAPGSHDT